jgi:hypothetical protein
MNHVSIKFFIFAKKIMKKILLLSLILFSASMTFAQPETKVRYAVITGDVRPNEMEQHMMRIEENKHPLIIKSIHNMEAAYGDLQNAADDFGGHKVQAMADIKASIMSLRKALYYRIYVDESMHH